MIDVAPDDVDPGIGASVRELLTLRVDADAAVEERDCLAIEEPLEIRAGGVGRDRLDFASVAVTMRTPGEDRALAAGFLFSEGLIDGDRDVHEIVACGSGGNTVAATLDDRVIERLSNLSRNFYSTSSCGVCGKASLEALHVSSVWTIDPNRPKVSREFVSGLPVRLRERQRIFEETGGLHAAALFDEQGDLIRIAEDVGRHNALDKLIGWALISDRLPLAGCTLVVSGRLSFELVQKASRAGVGLMVAVSAPSSLAVDLARSQGMTLVGFTRGDSFKIYSGSNRITTMTGPTL